MLKTSFHQNVIRFDLSRTIAGRGRYWTTAYLVDGMLVDSGSAHTAPELAGWLGNSTLRQIVNTHTHEDHIGSNGLLQRLHPGLEILAHPLAIPILADPRHRQPLHLYRRLFWGWPESSRAQPVADSSWIATDLHRFQVLYTPGHSPDHICIYEPDRGWLFTGDLFVGGQERALRDGSNIWQIIASLKRIASLPIAVLFPGSARMRENPTQELEAKISYLENFGAEVLGQHQKGWDNPSIIRRMCGKPMPIEWITMGNFSRKHLILSYLKFQKE